MAAAFRAAGISVHENFGTIERFEKSPSGVRMHYAKHGARNSAEAALVVMAVGWSTSARHVFAAGPDSSPIALSHQSMLVFG